MAQSPSETSHEVVLAKSTSQVARAGASNGSNNTDFKEYLKEQQQQGAVEPPNQATQAALPAENSSQKTIANVNTNDQIMSINHGQGVMNPSGNRPTQHQEVQHTQQKTTVDKQNHRTTTQSREPSETVINELMDYDNEKSILAQHQHKNQEKNDENYDERRDHDSSMDVDSASSIIVISDEDAEYPTNQTNQISPDYLKQIQSDNTNHYTTANNPDRNEFNVLRALKKTFDSTMTTAPVRVKKEPIS